MRRRARRVISLLAAGVVALVAVALGPGHERVEPDPDIATLLSLPDDQVDDYLADRPGLALKALNTRPDVVAEWWTEQSPEDRAEMVESAPETIGNLGGIDYASRDTANRAQLAERLDAAGKAVAADPSDSDAARRYAALSAIHGASKGKHDPARYLVELTDDQPPLAAVAVGDLDTARQVTYSVPGMGTYTDDMQLWTTGAENIHRAQGRAGAPAARSVIAWIGYVPPPPGLDATAGTYAAQGAPLLSADIRALTATRDGTGLDTVSVIAHSYGTTTAADALADDDLGLYAFVMLGSAGIEYRIGRAAALSADRVFAGEASADLEAGLGRIERIDPRSPSFGATVIGADGDPARGLSAVTGHAPILHSPYNDDPTSGAWTKYADPAERERLYAQHMREFGYLDTGTDSLENAARASTDPSVTTFQAPAK